MRIISGTARGKKLAVFSGDRVRPTADRVREALFSILTSRCGSLQGLAVLDLCAGTGALALEALSRGAQQAVLIEEHPESLRLIQNNLAACRLQERAIVLRGRLPQALPLARPHAPFDLIFLDPPYGHNLIPAVLERVASLDLLADNGLLVCESAASDPLPETLAGLARCDCRQYGTTVISFYSGMGPQS